MFSINSTFMAANVAPIAKRNACMVCINLRVGIVTSRCSTIAS